MKKAVLINYKWHTSATEEHPFSDLRAIALNGICIGKPRIINDSFDFMELRDSMVAEFEMENPTFLAKESILLII